MRAHACMHVPEIFRGMAKKRIQNGAIKVDFKRCEKF